MEILHTKGNEEDTSKPAIFRCLADYVVQYDLRGTEPIAGEDADAFGLVNGPYTCYPYWREQLNANLARAGMPFVNIPTWIGGKMSAIPFSGNSEDVSTRLRLAAQSLTHPKGTR